jgi:formamidopyrimidine-DNA glycosylase
MPELPEVETVRRGLAPVMEGARFALVECRRPDLRFPLPDRFADRLAGRTVTALSRRAKYLLADLDDGAVLIMHLGMSGSFRVSTAGDEATPGDFHHPRGKAAAHDHIVFDFAGGARVTYNDPRRFGFMTLSTRAGLAEHPLMKGIGLEPLGNALDGATLARLFQDKRAPLKAALLDQRLIAGLGNIYVCEALWRAGLAPTRAAGSLAMPGGRPRGEAGDLASSIRTVLTEAIEAGGSSLRDFVDADGELGYFQHSFAVYDREGEPCRRSGCSGLISRIVQSNRSTFFCAACQT